MPSRWMLTSMGIRRLLAAIGSLFLFTGLSLADVQGVGGAGNVATGYQPFTLTPNTATNLHVAWVEDDSLADALDGASQVDRTFVFGNIKRMLQSQGIEVHTYTYSQFQNWPVTANAGNFGQTGAGASGGAAAWQNLGMDRASDGTGGGGYAVVIMPYWSAWSGGQGHTGGKGILSKAYFFACSTSAHIIHFGNGSSAVHNLQDNDVAGKQFGACQGAWLQLQTNGSTVRLQMGPRVNSNLSDTLFSNILAAHKRAGALATGISQVVGYFRMPSQTDSVIAANDTIAAACKVYCTNQGNARTASPYADYVFGSDGSQSIFVGQGDLLWAIISKWVNTKPIKLAMSWNDYAEFGNNPIFPGRPGSWTTANSETNGNFAWPRASYLDSVVADLRTNYGVSKIVVGSSGDSVKNLVGSFNATPAATNYMGNLTNWNGVVRWGAHFHTGADSTTQARNPFGRGVSNFDTTGANVSSRITGQLCRAIIRRSDSLFHTLGVQTSGFMLPGNDALVPVGWNDYSNSNLCPAESLFSAIAGVGHNYVANFVTGSTDFVSPSSVVRLTASNTNSRWPIFADETYRTNGGSTIQFMGYDVVSSNAGSSTKPDSIAPLRTAGMLNYIQRMSNEYFGMYCPRYGACSPIVLQGSTSATLARPSVGRVRVLGWHATFLGNGGPGWYSDYYAQKLILGRIKALEDIAGRHLIEWAWPEETYDAVMP